jgi:uncharacterized LabA/DUF88 family protein
MCKDIFGDKDTYTPLIERLAGGRYDKVFYYDAVPGRDYNETQAAYEARVQPDHERFEQIQALDRVHVALGQIVGANRRQKGVDVRLSVDLMTHAFRRNITKATIFAGDADFTPLIQALVGEGLHVTLWHPPQANKELKGAADSVRLFSFANNFDSLSIDGHHPAFKVISSTHDGLPPHDVHTVMMANGCKAAGRWRGDCLTVWRDNSGPFWYTYSLAAPGSSLKNVLAAFDVITGWGIADTGEQWIQI